MLNLIRLSKPPVMNGVQYHAVRPKASHYLPLYTYYGVTGCQPGRLHGLRVKHVWGTRPRTSIAGGGRSFAGYHLGGLLFSLIHLPVGALLIS